mmetsp:Transcript_34996/g.81183  ORF Transcript_34996/g.81183 Transcript_34996/m.81183 type:complete len:238 (+) Transcript_34996:341-1054(+)
MCSARRQRDWRELQVLDSDNLRRWGRGACVDAGRQPRDVPLAEAELRSSRFLPALAQRQVGQEDRQTRLGHPHECGTCRDKGRRQRAPRLGGACRHAHGRSLCEHLREHARTARITSRPSVRLPTRAKSQLWKVLLAEPRLVQHHLRQWLKGHRRNVRPYVQCVKAYLQGRSDETGEGMAQERHCLHGSLPWRNSGPGVASCHCRLQGGGLRHAHVQARQSLRLRPWLRRHGWVPLL